MTSVHVGLFPYTSSITNGGNLCQGQNYTKNYYASSYTPKASQHKRKIEKEYNFLRSRQPSLKHFYKGIEGGSLYQECTRKYVVKTAHKPSFESDPRSIDRKNILESIKNFVHAFYMFCTPYALIGSVLNIISMSLLAVEKLSDISPLFFTGVMQAMVPHMFISIFITGINQLSDAEIDKINKPHLPLVSGKMSYTTGVIIVASSLILGLWLGWIIGSWPCILTLISFAVIWGAYSVNVPLLRWKRNPVLAAMCNVVTLSVLFPFGYFFHMQTFVFKRPIFFSRPLVFATASQILFSLVIALSKDLPDIEGDRAFGIQTFATRLGQKRVFWICIFLLEMTYGVALLMGATSPYQWSKIVTVLGHAILALVVLYSANKSIDFRNKASATSFYKFIWKLHYMELFLMPLVR